MTDHKAEALSALNETGELLGVDDYAYADSQVKAALVHATLYLAGQQRTVALIAFAQDSENPQAARDLAAIEARTLLGLS